MNHDAPGDPGAGESSVNGSSASTTKPGSVFSRDAMALDYNAAAAHIEKTLRAVLTERLHRRGLVLGVSGGIDSSVCAVLAARAVGPQRVVALLMPERESSPSSLANGKAACDTAGIKYEIHDLTPTLEALGCYRKRDEAIRRAAPGLPERGPLQDRRRRRPHRERPRQLLHPGGGARR